MTPKENDYQYMTRDMCEIIHAGSTSAITTLTESICEMKEALGGKLDDLTEKVSDLDKALYRDNGKQSFHTRLFKAEMFLRAIAWTLAAMSLPVLALIGVKVWGLIATGGLP